MTDRLFPIAGEFVAPEREAAFRAERLPETIRHALLLFLLSAGLNTLFLASDWRFHGTEHFWVAVPARLVVVGVSLLCWALCRKALSFRQAEAVMVLWQAATALAVAFLVSSRSDIALFVVMMLPSIFYLVVPTSFGWSPSAAPDAASRCWRAIFRRPPHLHGARPRLRRSAAQPGALPCRRAVEPRARTLLAEDVAINQEIARTLLENTGYEVSLVSGGAEAVMALQERPFDLVLMDVQMPVMDGIMATQHIRSLETPERDIPIIAVTANVYAEQIGSFRAAGINDHVGKPFRREELYEALDRWLADDRSAAA